MKNKYRGCLIGGAVGDALDYAVEFFKAKSIFQMYGSQGITEYDLVDGIAHISDDTQMTLFTATGLLDGTTRGKTRGIMGSYESYIGLHYKDWLKTQKGRYSLEREEFTYSWLLNVPEMYSRRAPGGTCLNALSRDELGTMDLPINDSKGCGGVMRVAPIGLYLDASDGRAIEKVDTVAAEAAALTHGHELGYIPAAGLAHIVTLVAHDDSIKLIDAVESMRTTLKSMFSQAKYIDDFDRLIEKAIKLASEDQDDLDSIRQLGEGWVAEETLAIAIYCALKYEDDFEKAIIASVNHDGDSDSTGAVTGNILGAYLGLDKIPGKYKEHLELYDLIIDIADDLYKDCPISEYSDVKDEKWERKYIYRDYKFEK